MNLCEVCGKATTVPPEPGWEVVIVVRDGWDGSAVFCPDHAEHRLGWLERHGVGVQYRMKEGKP